MLSEARKFGLRMNLANQTLCQLKSARGRQDLLETVLGNVGTMICFRLGIPDAERLRPFLKPFTPEQMQDLPNFQAFVRLLDENGPIGPFIMKTLK
jgi:DNA helicase HerA-like ATPase